MSTGLRLARLGGAQPDLLRRTPNDAPKYTAMGGVLISTALVAAASATFALHSVLGVPMPAAVLVGIGWGVVILNLDRMLIISMSVAQGRSLWLTALPRVLLAVLIGAVISTPLVLQIFDKEIDSEITRMQAERRSEDARQRQAEFADIPALQADLERQDAIASGRSLPSVEDDPGVTAADEAVGRADDDYEAKRRAADCEYNPTAGCPPGTGVPGVGDAYRVKEREATDAAATLQEARDRAARARSDAAVAIENAAPAARATAAQERDRLAQKLRDRQDLRSVTEDDATASTQNNDGLLARIEALHRLTVGNAMMLAAHLLLFLLFMAIEVLPVLTKVLSGRGDPTLYERLLAARERDAEKREQAWSDQARSDETERRRVVQELERYRNDQQIDAGKRATDLMVGEQSKVTERAIATWASVAAAHSDAELAAWYRSHVGGPGVPIPQPGPGAGTNAVTSGATRPVNGAGRRHPAHSPSPSAPRWADATLPIPVQTVPGRTPGETAPIPTIGGHETP